MKEHASGPTPQEAIRRHVEEAADWEWHDMASQLYLWTDRFNDRFFERQMPEVVLSFDRMDHRILAGYTLRRNAQGLLFEVTFNTKHLERPLWATLETLMHEYVHLWQQNYGEHPVERNYHNQEFVGKCRAIGLHPAIGVGSHLRPADGPFAEFLKAYGVPEPPPLTAPKQDAKGKPLDWWVDPEKRRRRRGQSTLRKWSCGCQNVRVGTEEFHAQCLRCGNLFEPVEPKRESLQEDQESQTPDNTTDSGWEQGTLDLASLGCDPFQEPGVMTHDESGHDAADNVPYGATLSPTS